MMENITNLVLIVVGFGVLIFVHELGHFVAARWAGIRAEAFAIGMGPVMLSWRQGIGLRTGSSWKEYERRARQHLESRETLLPREGAATPDVTLRQIHEAGDTLGLGETEYSLRWLPIGGFVKMLGQDDADPSYVSDDPRSFNSCPIGKRMVVVSAGVIMNIILAALLFIAAFMVGVRFEDAVVGDVAADLPAGTAVATNAERLGITEPGLQPGDRVTQIDGKPAETFADLQIASAMGRPERSLQLAVRRGGIDQPLLFEMKPEKDPRTGLLSLGIYPGSSTTLIGNDDGSQLTRLLEQADLVPAGVEPGMQMVGVNGRPLDTYEQFQRAVEASGGMPVRTEWRAADAGGTVEATLEVQPVYEVMRYPERSPDGVRDYEAGLLGLSPLVRIADVSESSHNAGILQVDDVVLQIGSRHGPRNRQFREAIAAVGNGSVELRILRDGREVTVQARVRDGMLNVVPAGAWDLSVIAEPMTAVLPARTSDLAEEPRRRATAVASLELFPRTRIDAVDGIDVRSWADLRQALRTSTESALAAGTGAIVELAVALPTAGAGTDVVPLELSAEDVAGLHELGWTTMLPSFAFEPIYRVRSAEGSPWRAIVMGVEETHKLIVMTYLTLDRLFRGTVGVEQLRGPVGIVHIGTKIADRGFTYLVFFLAMISVNLAVINFLPLPIVDGGLFLYLVYEKLKGRPPSVAFQNAATIVGLFLIGTAFLVVTWNDVVRLLG